MGDLAAGDRLGCGCSSLSGCSPKVESALEQTSPPPDLSKCILSSCHSLLHLWAASNEVQLGKICVAHPNPSAVPESTRQFIATPKCTFSSPSPTAPPSQAPLLWEGSWSSFIAKDIWERESLTFKLENPSQCGRVTPPPLSLLIRLQCAMYEAR